MTLALAQQGTNSVTTGSPISVTLGATPAPGSLLVAIISANTAKANVNTPSGWTLSTNCSVDFNSGANCVLIFWKVAGASESATVTVTTSAGLNLHLHVLNYTGTQGGSPFLIAGTPTTTAGATSLAVSAFGNPADLKVAAVAQAGSNGDSVSWTNGYAARGETTRLISADDLGANSSSTTGSWSTSRAAGALIVDFKPIAEREMTIAASSSTLLARTVLATKSATASAAVGVVKDLAHAISAAATATVSALRAIARTIGLSSSSSTALSKQVAHTEALSSSSTATLLGTRVLLHTIQVTASAAVSLAKQVSAAVSAASAGAVARVAEIRRTIATSGTGAASLTKRVQVLRSLGAGGLVSLVTTILRRNAPGSLTSSTRSAGSLSAQDRPAGRVQ
jgi:hypothetical protein